ncbi:hypothetical protein TRFO_32553 [Tritrichomonas foetus]|uniref:Uncharacterized protein n=1 Tax=Tritrichomonas foetus TaxID=1144522 RepID=A0A1J4JPM3_9EUKA|nr:hypothetical protein TRFO_32553 [Tritrichomonas foetus]|eukprot:OHT00690.1 hypothetical protein TRFO_32553 [Tritrichomonas foetus]
MYDDTEEEEEVGVGANDFSFTKRKKELQSLYHDFHSALAKMQEMPDFTVEDEEYSPTSSPNRKSRKDSYIQRNYELRTLIRELQSLKNESLEIKETLQSVKGKTKRTVAPIIEKVNALINILSSHIGRAEALLTSLKQ